IVSLRLRKQVEYPGTGTAAAELDPITKLEAGIAEIVAQQAGVEATLATMNSSYLDAARRAALGELPIEGPREWLDKIADLQIRRDGITAQLAAERTKMASMIA